MSALPASPPPLPGRGVLAGIGFLVLGGLILFGTGMIAGVRHDGPARDALVLGFAAWQVATTGFLTTLAGGCWLWWRVK